MNKNLIWLTFFLLPVFCSAQTVRWVVRPGVYDDLSLLTSNVVKCIKDGKTGLLDLEGNTILAADYDMITDFYEGMACILGAGTEKTVAGVVTPEGKVTMFKNSYYTLPGFEFFSEGLMIVSNKQGKVGFIDKEGKTVIAFDYKGGLPFSEGMACVTSPRRVYYIDKKGQQIRLELSNGGTPSIGFSFYNDKAYVLDEDDVWFSVSKDGTCTNLKKKYDDVNDYDYLGRLKSKTNASKTVPFQPALPGSNSNVKKVTENGRIGYAVGEQKILPCQLLEGGDFYGDVAVVTLNDAKGMIRLVNGAAFNAKPIKDKLTFMNEGNVECGLQVTTPGYGHVHAYAGGKELSLQSKGNNEYSFAHQPSGKAENLPVKVTVEDEGLMLWQGALSYQFKQQDPLTCTINVGATQSNNQATVTVTVKNLNTEAVTATVTLTGSPAFQEKTETITIPANGFKNVYSYFSVPQDLANQTVSVTTSEGGDTIKNGIYLKKYVPDNDDVDDKRKLKQLIISIKPENVAKRDGVCPVTATISNPNDVPVSTTVSMTGSDKFVRCSHNVSIPAHGSKPVVGYFQVQKSVSGQSVTVTTGTGASSTKSGISIRKED